MKKVSPLILLLVVIISISVNSQNIYYPEEFELKSALVTLPDGTIVNLLESTGQEDHAVVPAIRSARINDKNLKKTNKNLSTVLNKKSKIHGLIKTLNQDNGSYYTEKLDSIVGYDAVLVPGYDSVLMERNIEEYDEDGYLTEAIVLVNDTVTNNLVNANRYEFMRDQQGNLLQQLNYNWTGEVWAISGKSEREYNSNGQIKTSLSYNWSGNSWLKLIKYEYEYDENGQQTLWIYSRPDQNNEWENYFKVEYAYHENGEMAVVNYYSVWNPEDNVWTSETVTEYDEFGRMITRTAKVLNTITKEMNFSSKYEYEYLEDGSTVETRYGWNTEAQEFYQQSQIRYKFETQYENGKLTQEIKLNFVNENWEYEYKRVYGYDQWGNEILNELYNPFWGDYGELRERTIKAFTETGQQIKLERYIWELDEEYYYYKQIGVQFYEYVIDQDGKTINYTAYKWNDEREDWQVDYKSHYLYNEDNERTIERYHYNVDGYYSTFEKSYTTTLDYDDSIGKYTALRDDYGYLALISYNGDRKVDEITHSEDGEIYERVKCYYNKSGRDSLWIDYYYSEWNGDTVIYYVEFSYSEISMNETEITEFHYDNRSDTVFDEYGNITHIISGDKLIKHIVQDKRIIKSSVFNKYDGNWVEDGNAIFDYNNEGQIQTIIYEIDNYISKNEYVFKNDTLTINEYSKYIDIENSEWELFYKTSYIVDPSLTKRQFLQIPAALFEAYEGMSYPYEWHLQYDYGKILYIFDYYSSYDEPGDFVIDYKSEVYYSQASSLQGDGIISGYVFDKSGATKSVTTTLDIAGEPVEGVAVLLCASADNYVLAIDTTNTEGFYEFKGVPEGIFYIKVDWQDFEQSSTYEMDVTTGSRTFENKNFTIQNGEVVTKVEELRNKIKVYPNPASNLIYINASEIINALKIMDLSGHVKIYNNANADNLKVSTRNLPTGLYIFEIETASNCYTTKILIKN